MQLNRFLCGRFKEGCFEGNLRMPNGPLKHKISVITFSVIPASSMCGNL